MHFATIQELSIKEKKSLLERMVKLQEEVGELAQEVLIDQKSSGSGHKSAGVDGVLGEAVDVTLVALSIFFKHGGTIQQLEEISTAKWTKWAKHQEFIPKTTKA